MRFTETTPEAIGEEADIEGLSKTKWWLDTFRPLTREKYPHGQKYVAVQTEAHKDPNNFVQVTNMRILFNDQAEYYFVCDMCYSVHRGNQWAGSTRGVKGWRERADERLKKHEQQKGWCEFCDPIFGNGGWHV